jgi:NADPH:quinone reductase-like Zn-dependent oxidoreductase
MIWPKTKCVLVQASRLRLFGLSSRAIHHQISELKLAHHGNPSDPNSIQLETREISDSQVTQELHSQANNDLFVKLVAAPINPADINVIQGTYALLPKQLPANIGNEGLFEVVDSTNPDLKAGDWVLPTNQGFGCWRSHAFCSSNHFFKCK